MSELKPCPFCGGKAIEKNGIISCESCGAEVLFHKLLYRDSYGEEYIQELTESWNSRHE